MDKQTARPCVLFTWYFTQVLRKELPPNIIKTSTETFGFLLSTFIKMKMNKRILLNTVSCTGVNLIKLLQVQFTSVAIIKNVVIVNRGVYNR